MREPRIRNVLVLSDLHLRPACGGVPSGEDTATLAAVANYAKTVQWDEVVQLGDLCDFSCISTHNNHKPRLVEGARLQADFDHASRWLDYWQNNVCPGAKWTIIEGNHDERLERYADAFPAMAGKVELATNLNFAQRGINWVRYWTKGELYRIGNAYFGHGRSTARFHAAKMVADYGVNIFGGHTHTLQSYSQTLMGHDKTLVGESLGCLCRYDQPFMCGRPSRWQQAFAVFRFLPNGFFNHSVVRCFSGGFVSPDGVFYKRKGR